MYVDRLSLWAIFFCSSDLSLVVLSACFVLLPRYLFCSSADLRKSFMVCFCGCFLIFLNKYPGST